ncbi:MAG: hypothetical protein PVI86_03725 [Phycisphaerae bacterium]|jgi:endonuclease/exonuclease/phosphatase family metal-dependent hydrolase
MTYNVKDHICRNADKSEAFNAWHALARIIAGMRPDILLLQETGDNDGNGTPGGDDTVEQLETTIELFIHGGTDPFLGGTVGAYVQKYAPGYDLPYVFVSSSTDGFNRNVILSKFPFGDLNGDTITQRSDIGVVFPDAYAPGGNGGIRGFMFAEFDLPDDAYGGNIVVGNAHLKASFGDHDQRVTAAKNVAYYIDYLFNGAGTGVPDPNNKIIDSPPATDILDDTTPVVIGGDWNEDESKSIQNYGEKGPAAWLTEAQIGGGGGTDGTDRDRTDMTYDDSYVEKPSGSPDRSTQSNSKLDYLAWQDSIVALRRSFIFNTSPLSGTPAWYPPELIGFPTLSLATGLASDHRPVIADLILAEPIQDCNENEIPDECDISCSDPGDPCHDIVGCGELEDCNENQVPDECDVAEGTSSDEDGNGVPDECEIVVPTVSEYGLACLALGLMAVGTILARRRRHSLVT